MTDLVPKGESRTYRFDDIASIINDRVDNPEEAGVDRYVGLEHLDTDSFKIRRWGSPRDVTATKLRFRKGDIIFGRRRVYQRKLAVADFDGICSAHAMVLRAKTDVVLPEFLPFFMQGDIFMERAKAISVGSLSPTINWKSLAKEEFALPPLEDQRRIVATLRALRNAYESHRVLIERADSLWLSMAASVIRDANTEMQAGDAFEIQIGRQRSPKYTRNVNPCPYLRAANIKDGRLLLDDVLSMDFDDSDRERLRLERGDVLITEGCGSPDELGASARWDGEIPGDVCFQNTLIRLRPRPGLTTAAFAYVWARYAYKSGQFLQIARGSNILHIGARRLEAMRIRVPSLEQQKKLTDVLEDLDNATSSSGQRTGDLNFLWRSFLS